MKNIIRFILISFLVFGFIGCEDEPEEITIASWNLKNFGQTKLNDPARINVIVDVLKKYDIIAIQEVQDVSGVAPIKPDTHSPYS